MDSISGRRDHLQEQLLLTPKLTIREISLYPCDAVYMCCTGVASIFDREAVINTIAAIVGNDAFELQLFTDGISLTHSLTRLQF